MRVALAKGGACHNAGPGRTFDGVGEVFVTAHGTGERGNILSSRGGYRARILSNAVFR